MSNRVLVCDDALFMRAMIGAILTQGGYQVVGEAESGEEALAQYPTLQPDLVTMDLVMPGLGGVETVRRLISADPAARIVICSALDQESLVAQALAGGAREFVVKPFQAAQVLEAARRALAAPQGQTASR